MIGQGNNAIGTERAKGAISMAFETGRASKIKGAPKCKGLTLAGKTGERISPLHGQRPEVPLT